MTDVERHAELVYAESLFEKVCLDICFLTLTGPAVANGIYWRSVRHWCAPPGRKHHGFIIFDQHSLDGFGSVSAMPNTCSPPYQTN